VNLDNVDYSKGGGPRRTFGRRLWRALLVDATVYEEVEHDRSALPQAAAVVALAALAGALGGFAQLGFVRALVGGLVLWALGAAVVWAIGVRVLRHTSDYPELLRTLGFASAPRLLFLLGVVPIATLQGVVGLAVVVLSIVAWVVAVRQALDVSTGRAVAICLLAYAVSALVSLLIPGI
jgi:hypothetical protein